MAGEHPEQPHSPRRPCAGVMYIVPMDEAASPQWDAIVAVRCLDLSRSGASFLLSKGHPPQQFMVLLGDKLHGWIQIRSELIHFKPQADGAIVVGCRFLERTPTKPAAAEAYATSLA